MAERWIRGRGPEGGRCRYLGGTTGPRSARIPGMGAMAPELWGSGPGQVPKAFPGWKRLSDATGRSGAWPPPPRRQPFFFASSASALVSKACHTLRAWWLGWCRSRASNHVLAFAHSPNRAATTPPSDRAVMLLWNLWRTRSTRSMHERRVFVSCTSNHAMARSSSAGMVGKVLSSLRSSSRAPSASSPRSRY